MTTLTELINQLTDLAQEIDLDPGLEGATSDDVEVRIAIQPTWPLRFEVEAVTFVVEEDGRGRVFLATSEGHPYDDPTPYAPRAAWDGGVIYATNEDEEAVR